MKSIQKVLFVLLICATLVITTFVFLLFLVEIDDLKSSLLITNDIKIPLSYLAIIVAYFGIWTSILKPNKIILNLSLTGLSLISLILLLEQSVWKWIITFEEIDEWLFVGIPFLSLIMVFINNLVLYFKNKRNQSN